MEQEGFAIIAPVVVCGKMEQLPRSCGPMLKLPKPFKQIVSRDARIKYFSRNPLHMFMIERFFEGVFNLLNELQSVPQSFLEVGCGDGISGYVIRERFKPAEYLGVDIRLTELLVAGKVLGSSHLALVDGRRLPFRDRSFDVVLFLEIFEHMENWEKALAEGARVARKAVIFSVPAFPWFQLLNFLAGKNLRRWGEHPDHIRFFRLRTTEKQVRGAIESAGLAAKAGKIKVSFSLPWIITKMVLKDDE